MHSNDDLALLLARFFADIGVRSRRDAELPVAVLLRADRHRGGRPWSTFDVERFLAGLPDPLRESGGALVLSTFFSWLSDVGLLERGRGRALSRRAARFEAPSLRPAA